MTYQNIKKNTNKNNSAWDVLKPGVTKQSNE